MVLHQAQKKIAIDTHRFRVVNCGRRFGKTTLAIEEIKGKAVFNSEAKICYIAPTYQQARDIAWSMLKKEFVNASANVNESRLELEVHNNKGNTSTIALRGWESIETLRGQAFDFIVIDEIAMMRNFWVNWQEVIRPTLTDRKGEVLFISTPKGFNHFYDLYNRHLEDSNFSSHHFSSYDNPHIPPEELDEAKNQMTEDRFAQEYMADFRKTEGLVFKEFNRDYHTYTEDILPGQKTPAMFDTFIAIDFGFTNPAAILKIGKDSDSNFWILEEFYKPQHTNTQLIEVAKSFKGRYVYADPAEPDRIEEFKRAGLYIRDVKKTKDSIKNGIDKIRELFKQQRIKIHRSCKNLIWELETYSYPDRRPDHNEEELPIKENDHAVDALRYAIMTNEPQDVYAQSFTSNNKSRFK
jgi:PBSX family phage terminase large subunit